MSEDELKSVFRELLGPDANPHPFQLEVAQLLLSGQSVILKAPTGSGKTLAALLPYLAARRLGQPFPHRMLHAAPMRTLVEQFCQQARLLPLHLDIRCQTGARAEDPLLEGDITYLTIDQLLANYLGLAPYLPTRLSGITRQRVRDAYLVFDEIHLFEPDTALATVIELLTWLNGLTPFLLMTATLSETMLGELAHALNPSGNPQREVAVVRADEAAPARRTFHTIPQPMTVTSILRRHHGRSIVVCNTVERAQLIYQKLLERGRSEDNTILLHSRFRPADRYTLTCEAVARFGKEAIPTDSILVTTQVAEAGMDITGDTLHSEVAPVNAVIQRAGRCARFGGDGDVYVYPLAGNASGSVSYLPYDKALCERSYALLSKRDNQRLGYHAECELVDLAHTEADRRILNAINEGRAERRELMYRTICWAGTPQSSRQPLSRQLIRSNSALRFILADNPASTLDPDEADSFSYGRPTFERLLQGAGGGAVMWYYQQGGQPRWWAVTNSSDLEREGVFALSTRYASYSPRLGLKLRPAGDGRSPVIGSSSKPRTSRWQPNGNPALLQLLMLARPRQGE